MKYNIGDKVRIRKDLVAGKTYGCNTYIDKMNRIAKNFDYILTIGGYNDNKTQYTMDENGGSPTWYWTDEMIEGLVEEQPTDREKFERWMRYLSSLDGCCKTYDAFNNLTMLEPDDDEYEDNLKTVSDYLFGIAKKKMTVAEIEAELGYEIEIVEG